MSETVFSSEIINSVTVWKKERASHLKQALSCLIPQEDIDSALDTKAGFAIAHHWVYSANEISKKQDSHSLQALHDSINAFLANREKTSFSKKNADHPEGNLGNAGVYLLTNRNSILDVPELPQAILDETEIFLSNFPDWTVLKAGQGINLYLDYRTMDDSLSGYSISSFPCTQYLDWTDSGLRNAENIVHEAAHSYLNMLLKALNLPSKVKSKQMWYSPWRDEERPCTGIIHGAFAFSIVFRFFDYYRKQHDLKVLSKKQLQYCDDRCQFELSRLKIVKESLDEALQEYGSPEIGTLVRNIFPNG